MRTKERTIRIPADPAILGYVAGLLDGEGNIYARGYSVDVSIANTNVEVLRWVQRTFVAGRIAISHRARGNHKDCYAWHIGRAADIAALLKSVLPYLIIKRGRAEKMIGLCERRVETVAAKFRMMDAISA